MNCAREDPVGFLRRCIGAEDERPDLFLGAKASLNIRIITAEFFL